MLVDFEHHEHLPLEGQICSDRFGRYSGGDPHIKYPVFNPKGHQRIGYRYNQGSNLMVENNSQRLVREAFKILDGKDKKGSCPMLWDDKAAGRIVNSFRTTGR